MVTLLVATIFAVLIYYFINRRIKILERERAVQTAFAQRLIAAQEIERKRIAGELHDGLGQNLLVIKNWILLARQRAGNGSAEILKEISDTASQTIDEVRRIAYNLRPYQIDEIGLTRALEGMLKRLAATTEIRLTWQFDNIDNTFTAENEINLFRIVQDCADNGAAALNLIQTHKPDLAVLDVNMPEMNGFDVVRRLQEARSKTTIAFLPMHKDEEMFNAAMDLGVSGYILKDSAVTEIVACLKMVLSGQPYISPQLSAYLLNRSRRANELSRELPQLESLTATERRVLKMIADYKTSKEIADILCIHSRTVDNHRTNIAQKLDLNGSHSLLKFAVENKSRL